MTLSATTELNKFIVKKRKNIQALTEGIEKLLEDSVGKGFFMPQGNLAWSLQGLMVETKKGLTEANIAVVTEQIELEIEITTKEYQIQIEQAKVAWDLEKTNLLNTFALEIAQLELMYNLKEEEINEISLEIENRKSVLLIAKTDLAVAIEALNKQLAEIDASTVRYEVLLIQAKIATNTEKLKIIPYLQQLIIKEGELLAVLSGSFGIEYDLITAKQQLIAAKKSLLPLLFDKAGKKSELATALYNQVLVDLERADMLMDRAANEEDRTDAIIEVSTEEHDVLAVLNKDLLILRNSVELLRLLNQTSHIEAVTDADNSVSSTKRNERSELTSKEVTSAGILRTADNSAFTTGQTERKTVVDTNVGADKSEISGKAAANAIAIEGIAVISSKAEVTSKLVHLVGSV